MRMMLLEAGRWGKTLALMSALLLAVACGDVETFKVHSGGWGQSTEHASFESLDGCFVELVRVSSRCGQAPVEGLLAPVGSATEFTGEQVIRLESPCGGGPEVWVDIDLAGHSILLDFSNVAAAGRFPSGEFEGFVVTDLYHLVSDFQEVHIDREMSTMDIPEESLTVHAHSVAVNLAGMPYDSSSFVKLDLVLASDLE